jgi:hypothetical protein
MGNNNMGCALRKPSPIRQHTTKPNNAEIVAKPELKPLTFDDKYQKDMESSKFLYETSNFLSCRTQLSSIWSELSTGEEKNYVSIIQ